MGGFFALLCGGILISCSAEDEYDIFVENNLPSPPPLDTRTNVIKNLQYAYDYRDIDALVTMLDTHFIFVFQEADANNPDPGERTPTSWFRDDEINATTNLFDDNFSDPEQPAADEVLLSLAGLESVNESSWLPYTGSKHVTDPSTWYELVVRYDLEVQVGEDRLLSEDRARFIVREIDLGGKKEWRLVYWADLEDI